MKLNKYQEAAVRDESNACLVRANVGSGKTTVLIEKIRYLHEEKQVPLEQMIVLTFTNKAANEIIGRLGQQKIESMETDRDSLYYGTFHSVAMRMLQNLLPIEELGFTREFQICLPEEELELAQQLIRENKLKIKYKNRLKKRLEQAQRWKSRPVKDYGDDFFRLVELLQNEKKKQNKLSYQDLLTVTCNLLELHPERIRPSWIIIDEVQDCDEIQLELIKQLKKPETGLFAVGDPNQVIYSWRGSVFNIFYRMNELFQARELTLPVNYRSSGNILAVSRRFQETGDTLEGMHEDGEKIVVRNHYDSFQEAEYLAEKIANLHAEGKVYRQIAVFYRLQSQSEILEKVFREHQIPFEISQKKTLQDIPVLVWFLHVLRFLSNREETDSAVLALCDKNYGEGWTTKKAQNEIKKLTEGSVLFSPSALLQKMWEYQDKGNAYGNLLEELGILPYLHPTAASFEEDRGQLRTLTASMEGFGSIRDFLNDLVLNGMQIIQEEGNEDSVKLMTLHASKGLEFDVVFIIGVNNGLIPLNSKDEASEEEERRLFYVGMTRAKEYLELSYYTNPDGVRIFPGPGRYLSFLPEQSVEMPHRRDLADAAEHLQTMKRMILEERAKNAADEIEASAEIQKTVKTQMEENATEQAEIRRRVQHPKYGKGEILSETEDMVTVLFDDYGEKELLKAFSQLSEEA